VWVSPVFVHHLSTLAAISRYYHLQKAPAHLQAGSPLFLYLFCFFFHLLRHTKCSIFHGMGMASLILVRNPESEFRFELTREDDGGGGAHNSEEGAIDGVVAAHFRRHFALFVVCFLGYKWSKNRDFNSFRWLHCSFFFYFFFVRRFARLNVMRARYMYALLRVETKYFYYMYNICAIYVGILRCSATMLLLRRTNCEWPLAEYT